MPSARHARRAWKVWEGRVWWRIGGWKGEGLVTGRAMACIKSLSLDDKSIMTKIEDIELQKNTRGYRVRHAWRAWKAWGGRVGWCDHQLSLLSFLHHPSRIFLQSHVNQCGISRSRMYFLWMFCSLAITRNIPISTKCILGISWHNNHLKRWQRPMKHLRKKVFEDELEILTQVFPFVDIIIRFHLHCTSSLLPGPSSWCVFTFHSLSTFSRFFPDCQNPFPFSPSWLILTS